VIKLVTGVPEQLLDPEAACLNFAKGQLLIDTMRRFQPEAPSRP
jgi:hypothetical protein